MFVKAVIVITFHIARGQWFSYNNHFYPMWDWRPLPNPGHWSGQAMLTPNPTYLSTSKTGFVCKVSDQRDLIGEDPKGLSSRSFLLNKSRQWPHGVIPYEMDLTFSENQVAMINEAMEMISNHSCVKLVPRNDQTNYVFIRHHPKTDVCNSAVGRKRGKQMLNLGDSCFDVENGYQGAILHEMMHAVGFIHEQQRLDRDCYVQVAKQSILSRKHDFAIVPNTDTTFPYDINSIMHYGFNEHMSPLEENILGNFDGHLTDLDIMKLYNMYCGGPTYCESHPIECTQLEEARKKCIKE